MNIQRFGQIATVVLALLPQVTLASSGAAPLPQVDWSFLGPFGTFDRAALKRGAQVVTQVCMSCHSVKYIKFDHLRQVGMNEADVTALAESQGKTKKDRMLSQMDANAAKESFGVVPPDLSLMIKARKGYENYTYGILTGYLNQEESDLVNKVMEDGKISDEEAKAIASKLHLDAHNPDKMLETLKRIKAGDNFNKYFPGNFFAMPQPVSDGAVTYADGTTNNLDQLAKDTVSFLAWASEPIQEERKATGFKVIIYLIILSAMLFAVKRRIWAKIHH
ncbi:MAG: hypothetical protein G8345_05695 [Magnetococcales bacterium]|nr:hypothetical protein [Magnetococcales bacterium]NGZ26362.1 hypothetical protein [Magnetococcales bacterium]